MFISIRYGKNAKIAKCLSQLGMEKTQKLQNIYMRIYFKLMESYLQHSLVGLEFGVWLV